MEHIDDDDEEEEEEEKKKKKKRVSYFLYNMKLSHFILLFMPWSEMTIKFWVIVQRYPFPNGVVGGLIPAVKSSLYLMEETKN